MQSAVNIDELPARCRTYYVRVLVSNLDRRNLLYLDELLEHYGFVFEGHDSQGTDLYDHSYVTAEGLDKLRDVLCQYRDNIEVKYCKQQYAKDSDRLNEFLEQWTAYRDEFRCSYCGKKLTRENMEIDHIFPASKMMESDRIRIKAWKFDIYETECMSNYAPACHYCNYIKGDNTGFWVVRGVLGHSDWFWIMLKVIGVFLIVLAIIWAIVLLNCGALIDFMQYNDLSLI